MAPEYNFDSSNREMYYRSYILNYWKQLLNGEEVAHEQSRNEWYGFHEERFPEHYKDCHCEGEECVDDCYHLDYYFIHEEVEQRKTGWMIYAMIYPLPY